MRPKEAMMLMGLDTIMQDIANWKDIIEDIGVLHISISESKAEILLNAEEDMLIFPDVKREDFSDEYDALQIKRGDVKIFGLIPKEKVLCQK